MLRKETGLDMVDLQGCATPCNASFITRKEVLGQRFESARRLSTISLDKLIARNGGEL
jgi:hypothetical protein